MFSKVHLPLDHGFMVPCFTLTSVTRKRKAAEHQKSMELAKKRTGHTKLAFLQLNGEAVPWYLQWVGGLQALGVLGS